MKAPCQPRPGHRSRSSLGPGLSDPALTQTHPHRQGALPQEPGSPALPTPCAPQHPAGAGVAVRTVPAGRGAQGAGSSQMPGGGSDLRVSPEPRGRFWGAAGDWSPGRLLGAQPAQIRAAAKVHGAQPVPQPCGPAPAAPQAILDLPEAQGGRPLLCSKPHSGSHRSGHAPAHSAAAEAQHRGDLQPHLHPQRRLSVPPPCLCALSRPPLLWSPNLTWVQDPGVLVPRCRLRGPGLCCTTCRLRGTWDCPLLLA